MVPKGILSKSCGKTIKSRLGPVSYTHLALSVADVGIAMGSGTDIAIESADLVLTTNNLLGLARAFDMSKKTFNLSLIHI